MPKRKRRKVRGMNRKKKRRLGMMKKKVMMIKERMVGKAMGL